MSHSCVPAVASRAERVDICVHLCERNKFIHYQPVRFVYKFYVFYPYTELYNLHNLCPIINHLCDLCNLCSIIIFIIFIICVQLFTICEICVICVRLLIICEICVICVRSLGEASRRERRFAELLFPALAVGKWTAPLGDLLTADAGKGGEHTAQLAETGIASSLDVLKRVVGKACTTFEGGVGDAQLLEPPYHHRGQDSSEL